MERSLKEYLGEIRSIPLDNRLSDDAVVALMNIHLSVLTMLVADGLEGKYGSAAFHRAAMEKLYAICRRRSTDSQTLLRRSRLVPAMYTVFSMPDSVFDARKYEACLTRSFRMADEWHERTKDARPQDRDARIVEYGVLESILEAFVYVVDADREADRDYRWLMRRVGEWASSLGDDGSWAGLPEDEAVRRLHILTGHANIAGDRRFDAQIEKALQLRYERIAGSGGTDCQTLCGLYWTLMRSIGRWDSRKLDTLADCAACRAEAPQTTDPDQRLMYMAVHIDRACMTLHHETKQKMLACSA